MPRQTLKPAPKKSFWDIYQKLLEVAPDRPMHDLPWYLELFAVPVFVLFISIPVWLYNRLFG